MNTRTAHTPVPFFTRDQIERIKATPEQADKYMREAEYVCYVNADGHQYWTTNSRAQLVEHNERMRQALTAAAGHFESHAHAMSATGWNLTAGVMKERARECRAALNPPPTK